VRYQSEQAIQRFFIGYSIIPSISFFGSANESGLIARPNIVLSNVSGWFNAELFDVTFTLLDGLVMTAHCIMLASNFRGIHQLGTQDGHSCQNPILQ
jgi:hypothetical protein